MADVYINGYLTIAAARASHCNEGFLNPRKAKYRDIVLLRTEQGPCDLHFYYDDLIMSPGSIETVTATPLSIRQVRRFEPAVPSPRYQSNLTWTRRNHYSAACGVRKSVSSQTAHYT